MIDLADTFESHDDRTRSTAPAAVLVVTILWHPDLARVGDFVVWRGAGPWKVSRAEPHFHGAPLATERVSRDAFEVRAIGDACIIERAGSGQDATVAGRALEASVELPAAALARGVAWTIGKRVALWLERRPEPRVGVPPIVDYIGESEPAQRLRAEVAVAARGSHDVSLWGETGTGKELVARALHGDRPEGTLVPVDVGAITPTLFDAECFGVEKKVIQGAETRAGFFERAHLGTLFLDEVGNLEPELQPRLLRALQSRVVRRVGEAGPGRKVDFRLVTATNADLAALVARGAYRGDLVARFGNRITLPPLRDRPSDLGHILVAALRRALTSTDPTRAASWLRATDVAALTARAWPFNVRGVERLAELLVHRAGLGTPPWTEQDAEAIAGPRFDALPATTPLRAAPTGPMASSLRCLEVVAAHGYRLQPAAAELATSRTTVRRRIAKLPDYRRIEALGPSRLDEALAAAGRDVDKAAAQLGVDARVLHYALRRPEGTAGR